MLDREFLVDGPTSTKNAERKAKGGVPSTCHPRGTPHLPGAACRGRRASSDICRVRRERGEEYLHRQPRTPCRRTGCRRFATCFAGGSSLIVPGDMSAVSRHPWYALDQGADRNRCPTARALSSIVSASEPCKSDHCSLRARGCRPQCIDLGARHGESPQVRSESGPPLNSLLRKKEISAVLFAWTLPCASRTMEGCGFRSSTSTEFA